MGEDDPATTGDAGAGQGTTDAGQGGGAGAGDAGHGPSAEELRQAIREVLSEMGIAGPSSSGDGQGDGDKGGDGGPPDAGSARDREGYWHDIVARELERIRTTEGLAELKDEVRKIVERPPRKFRRVERAMWGARDE